MILWLTGLAASDFFLFLRQGHEENRFANVEEVKQKSLERECFKDDQNLM